MQIDGRVQSATYAHDIFNRMYDVLPTHPATPVRDDALANNLFLRPSLPVQPSPVTVEVYVPLIDSSYSTPKRLKTNYLVPTDHTHAFAPSSSMSWSGIPRVRSFQGPGTPEQPPVGCQDAGDVQDARHHLHSHDAMDLTTTPTSSHWTTSPSTFMVVP
jgi:hypothetical protein